MAKLIINTPCEGDRAQLSIYIEGSDIVFSVEPNSPEDDPYVGDRARMPVNQFRDMLDKLLSVKSTD